MAGRLDEQALAAGRPYVVVLDSSARLLPLPTHHVVLAAHRAGRKLQSSLWPGRRS